MKYLKKYEIVDNQDLINEVKYGTYNSVKKLIDKGADINKQNIGGFTPLMFAIWYDRIDIIKLLIESGANLDIQSDDGNYSLYLACFNGNLEIVKLLLENGVNPNLHFNIEGEKSNGNLTPLRILIERFERLKLVIGIEDLFDILYELIKYGSDATKIPTDYNNYYTNKKIQEAIIKYQPFNIKYLLDNNIYIDKELLIKYEDIIKFVEENNDIGLL